MARCASVAHGGLIAPAAQAPLERRHDSGGLFNPERIRVPVILSAQFGEENITSRLGAAQIERNGQLCLIADSAGDPCAIGDTVRAFAARYDDDGVRSGFAEARKDHIDVQQGCGKIERRFGRLLFGTAKGSIVGEVESSIDSGGCLLTGRWVRCDGSLAIPVFCNEKPGKEAHSAEGSDGGQTRRCWPADGGGRAEVKQSWQAMAAGGHMLHAGIREREGPRFCRIFAQEGFVGAFRSAFAPRLSLRIGAQLFNKPLLGIDIPLNLSHLVLPHQGYQI